MVRVKNVTLDFEQNMPNETANLYLPDDVWKALVQKLGTNRLTVVLRMKHECI